MNEPEKKTELEQMAETASTDVPEKPETPATDAPVTEAPTNGSLAETAAAASEPRSKEELEKDIIATLQTIYDPEIPVNIHELGLIYEVNIGEKGHVDIVMTLTAPGCPVAGPLVQEVEYKVSQVPGVAICKTELTFDPPWDMDKMSEAARLQLGFM